MNVSLEFVQIQRPLSGAAPVPWRSKEVEQEILGKHLDEKTIPRGGEAA